MFPIVVGAWLPVLTFLTYAAHRLRLPILAIAVLLFTVVANYMPRLHVMCILEQDAQSGPLQSRQPSLEESLQWWRKANGCPEALRSECNVRPIIVAAEGGASRAVDEVRLGCGDARDYHLTLGQPDLLEQLPFVCVARVSGFERDGMRIGEETGRPLATAFPGLALDGYTDRRGGGGGAAAGRRPRRSALRKAAGIAARHPSRRARNPIRRGQHHRVDVSGAWARSSTGRRDLPPAPHPSIGTSGALISADSQPARHRAEGGSSPARKSRVPVPYSCRCDISRNP